MGLICIRQLAVDHLNSELIGSGVQEWSSSGVELVWSGARQEWSSSGVELVWSGARQEWSSSEWSSSGARL